MSEIQLDTKQKIINSAIELFAQKGYTETSVKEIATLSGIKAASLYNHFNSKIEILESILQMYIKHTTLNTLSKETILKKAEMEDPEKLLMSMFYRYNKKEVKTYTQILKIILHEQYRNEQVGNFMKDHFIKQNEEYIDFTLTALIEKKRIAPINHGYYAKILNDLCIASTIQYGHFSNTEEYKRNNRITMDDVIGFIIDIILKDDGSTSDKYLPGIRKWVK